MNINALGSLCLNYILTMALRDSERLPSPSEEAQF
jgi:hypothetical protein